jgi:4-carboxymuconolactone decarboxylase
MDHFLRVASRYDFPAALRKSTQGSTTVDLKALYERGMRLRKQIFGDETVEKRMSAAGEFGAPLQTMINAYAFGDVWSRPGLPLKSRSLVVLAMTAAMNRPEEFRVHMNGALANGCSPDEIREVLLMVALYAGIPAANEVHKIAHEVIAGRRDG